MSPDERLPTELDGTRFAAAYRSVCGLARPERYTAAFIFGSVARGEGSDRSDLDVKVVVHEGEPDDGTLHLSHPIIGGVKLDISFNTLARLRDQTRREIEAAQRIPMLAESMIVFDKGGELGRLKEWAAGARPQPAGAADHRWLAFMVYHTNDKVERSLTADPPASLVAMHAGLSALLEIHYQLQGRWWVSSKRLLGDLRAWDAPLAVLVEEFVAVAEPGAKFGAWSRIVDHVLAPLGGRRPIDENGCDCERCAEDVRNLLVLD